jgi:hypothetical protein
VANPNKPPEIARILKRNKERLLIFLKDFHNDKDGELARMQTVLGLDAPWRFLLANVY